MPNIGSKICPQCGAPLDATATICKYCGAEVAVQQKFTAPQQQAPQYTQQQVPQYAQQQAPQYTQQQVPHYAQQQAPQYAQQQAPQYTQQPGSQFSQQQAPQYAPQYAQQPVYSMPPQGYNTYINTKSKVVAGLLAIFLGGFGIHKFYTGHIGLGILYLLFFWTYIPSIIGIIEGIIYLISSNEKFNLKYVKRK